MYIPIKPLLALVIGILVLVLPRNAKIYAVAVYLIVLGVMGILKINV